MANENNILLDIENLKLSFITPAGEVKALNDVSISLKQGDVLGIVGESGSGKGNEKNQGKGSKHYFPGSHDFTEPGIYHRKSD